MTFNPEKYINKTVAKIPPSGIRRFFELAAEMEEVVSLGVGEPDFVTPWHIRDEGIYSLEKGKTHYTSNAGLKELRIEIAKYMKRRFNLTYDGLTQSIVTVGGSEAIDLFLRTVIEPGDEVLIPEPSFVCYSPITVLAGGVPIPVRTYAENQFRLTPADIEPKITDKTKVLVLPFPNNPTGAIMERADLEAIS